MREMRQSVRSDTAVDIETDQVMARLIDHFGSKEAVMAALAKKKELEERDIEKKAEYQYQFFSPESIGESMPGKPSTKEQRMALFQQSNPDAFLGSVRPPMEMRTDGIPVGNVPTMGRSMTSLLDPFDNVAQSANWPEGGVGGGAVSGLSPWKGYSMGTDSMFTKIPRSGRPMPSLEDPFGPSGFQNVINPDQLAETGRIYGETSSPLRPDPTGRNWEDVMSGSPDYLTSASPPVTGPLDYRLTTGGLGTPWVDQVKAKNKLAGILGPDTNETDQTGYNKSDKFNSLLGKMLMHHGFDRLNNKREW